MRKNVIPYHGGLLETSDCCALLAYLLIANWLEIVGHADLGKLELCLWLQLVLQGNQDSFSFHASGYGCLL